MAATMRPYSEIDYLVADRVATITLSRPDQLNAFTQVMRDELIDAFDGADSDDDVRAVAHGRRSPVPDLPNLGVSPRAALRDALSRQAAAPGSRRHVGTSARPVAYTDDGPDG